MIKGILLIACLFFSLHANAQENAHDWNKIADGMVAALMARAAVLGSLLNVRINLASIRDEAFVAEQRAARAALQELALAEEAKILALVPQLQE
jgi:formiminotetrahydrofolate cyclodeaminase